MEKQHTNKLRSTGLQTIFHEKDLMEHGMQTIRVSNKDGTNELFDRNNIVITLAWALAGYEKIIDVDAIIANVQNNLFDGISSTDIDELVVLAVTAMIESDPGYGYVAARLLLKKLFKQVTQQSITIANYNQVYQKSFVTGIEYGVKQGLLDRRMLDFDLSFLATCLATERDYLFDYMGFKTLYERYFLKHESVRIELPQAFWMRVAMGLSYNEHDKNKAAVQFYDVISHFLYVPGTPTLLHAGLTRPQLSSCYLTTIDDDLVHIFKCYGDNAQLSKWSGGVANDWTQVRACGSFIKTIRTESQGVIPFLKIANDVTAAINRSGKRRSATCVYLETWHLEIEDFLDLKKNTGDERRRTHDINTANWIPDLFMERVINDQMWTLFCPSEVPDLHDLYGKAFKIRYEEYEDRVRQGKIKMHKTIAAKQLWRKMLSRLFETGHPWITFKDPSNIRSPQDHVGVVHSSNLCTEILLNTSAEETAVCNLGSINLARHIIDGKFDIERVAATVTIAVRMLDNVIDINFYPTNEAKHSNLKHRPIGLGLMGFQDALYLLNVNFSSKAALDFADLSMEVISYYAILTSSMLAKERGMYESYKGSKWDRGILPQDTLDLLTQERDTEIQVAKSSKLDWTPVRNHVQKYGMRNSNVMAIAPTATISNIVGCFPCIEPIYKNLYVKSNMSGEFTVVNKYLVEDLKLYGLWNPEMLDQIKYFDGNVQMIDSIPDVLKEKYKEAFELDPLFLIDITAVRGKWIDQGIAHNVFMKGVSGKLLDEIYTYAWKKGLKTTYYLRTLGASQVEKSTLDAKKFGFTQKRAYQMLQPQDIVEKTCSLSQDPECEVCQ